MRSSLLAGELSSPRVAAVGEAGDGELLCSRKAPVKASVEWTKSANRVAAYHGSQPKMNAKRWARANSAVSDPIQTSTRCR